VNFDTKIEFKTIKKVSASARISDC
jgi:hypothetical protein